MPLRICKKPVPHALWHDLGVNHTGVTGSDSACVSGSLFHIHPAFSHPGGEFQRG